MSTLDDQSWLGSGVGRSAPGELRVHCSEPVHKGERLTVRDLRRGVGGWFVNPDVDTLREDPTPTPISDGIPIDYRVRIILRCGCGLNLPLAGDGAAGRRAVHVLDALADRGVAEIELRRLCALVSNWR